MRFAPMTLAVAAVCASLCLAIGFWWRSSGSPPDRVARAPGSPATQATGTGPKNAQEKVITAEVFNVGTGCRVTVRADQGRMESMVTVLAGAVLRVAEARMQDVPERPVALVEVEFSQRYDETLDRSSWSLPGENRLLNLNLIATFSTCSKSTLVQWKSGEFGWSTVMQEDGSYPRYSDDPAYTTIPDAIVGMGEVLARADLFFQVTDRNREKKKSSTAPTTQESLQAKEVLTQKYSAAMREGLRLWTDPSRQSQLTPADVIAMTFVDSLTDRPTTAPASRKSGN